ncbi:unnamed protein product [Notodromas monacha]|uniref:Uncharacterized protein n=1 Tax=Notodromas monacha TaxID=399045 RepID=A0A7R9BRB1_9CRUS|nr:unnamed protein product [Notodromas monacha]CAG0920253.1 unnamed protein product [Notodromas monacha]
MGNPAGNVFLVVLVYVSSPLLVSGLEVLVKEGASVARTVALVYDGMDMCLISAGGCLRFQPCSLF